MATVRLVAPLLALLLLGPGCGKTRYPCPPCFDGVLAITAPSDVIKCGASQPFTATYTKGGSTQTVTPTWSTDDPAIATIDATGELTAVSHGEVRVTARYEDANAVKPVRIVNDYGTRWAGHYTVARCVATNDWQEAGFCGSGGFSTGQTLEIRLDFQQEGEIVTGATWLGYLDADWAGALNGRFGGSVGTAGNLTGESKGSYSVEGVVVDVVASPFNLLRQGERITEGSLTLTFKAPRVLGVGVFDARVMGLDKVAGTGVSAPQLPRAPRTLRDAWQLMRPR